MTARLPAPRLLLVTNRSTAKYPLPELAVRAIAGGVDVVQIREKDLTETELMRVAAAVLEAVGDTSRIMINGSIDVASKLGIGLHLPESHAQLATSHREAFNRMSRAFHIESDLTGTVDYDFGIIGHVFETGGKAGQSPLGIERLSYIIRTIPFPTLAIGGMTLERVAPVIQSGAHGIAVLSAINESHDPELVASSFRTALEKAMSEHFQELIPITLNGKSVQVPWGVTVTGYLASRGFHERLVVVELNGSILPKKSFAETVISAGDKVEIVHFVGGG